MAIAAMLRLLRSRQSTTLLASGNHLGVVVPLSRALSPKTAIAQRQWSSRAADESIGLGRGREEGNEEKGTEVVYYGPHSNFIKESKLPMLFRCFVSAPICPLCNFMASCFPPDTPPFLANLVSFVAFVAPLATLHAAYVIVYSHWLLKPYVHKLRWRPGSDSFEVEMMSWWPIYLSRTIKFSDIRHPRTKRPLVSFEANGHLYFVDASHIHNKELLAKLTPSPTSS